MKRPGVGAAALGGLLLGLASPPEALPFAAWLVLPALMLWYRSACDARRPLLSGYLYGCVHMAWFSWSLRHVLLGAYVAIVVVGGLYYLLANALVRASRPSLRPFVFGAAVTTAFWLRATMPEIHYPHGQPAHCLWRTPLVDGVALVGEAGVNATLALFAASLFEMWRSWRLARPAWWRAWTVCVVAVVTWCVPMVAAWLSAAADSSRRLRVVAIEPGVHSLDYFADQVSHDRLLDERLIAPTRALLEQPEPPALVCWPESSVFGQLSERQLAAGRVRLRLGALTEAGAPAGRLLLGTQVSATGAWREPSTAAACLVELPSGRVVAWQQKQRLVPGGEFLPLLGALPQSWADWLRDAFENALGPLAAGEPGASRPPFDVAGAKVGALMCYDNAFPGPAAERAAAGADLLVVLSNETWYRGGGELEQLLAMASMRARECGLPVLRCTTDGRTALLDARGVLLAELAPAPAPQPTHRILDVSIALPIAGERAMAWTARHAGSWLAALACFAFLHGLWRRDRLRSDPSALATGGVGGSAAGGPGGS